MTVILYLHCSLVLDLVQNLSPAEKVDAAHQVSFRSKDVQFRSSCNNYVCYPLISNGDGKRNFGLSAYGFEPLRVSSIFGRTFKSMIQDMLKSWGYFNNELWKAYLSEAGNEIYRNCLNHSKERFPNYVKEIQGMADGSDVPFEKLFLLNIDSIITASQTSEDSGQVRPEGCVETGCTSIICNKDEIILGHTEDAMCEILNNVYIVSAEIVDEAGKTIENFTTFAYAGHLPGNAMGFNSSGMIHSVNTLFPIVHTKGSPRGFIQRAILGARSIEELLIILRDNGSGIADGFSLNVHFAKAEGPPVFYNIEVLPPTFSSKQELESLLDVFTINSGETYVHCNKYMRMNTTQESTPINVSTCRHRTMDNFPHPEGLKDIKCLLSDQSDPSYPIFICDRIVTKLSHIKTVAVGFFNLVEKTWEIYIGRPSESQPVAVIPMKY